MKVVETTLDSTLKIGCAKKAFSVNSWKLAEK